jgi:thiamine-monophosphate kinase
MDERAALDVVGGLVDAAGDDAAVVDDTVFTIDMLHASSDFPAGTTRYTAGWRAVAASLSDVAAMGAAATAAVAVYGAPSFEANGLREFVRGASDVCRVVEAEYVGGDLDEHAEFTVATAAIGETETPVRRSGATPGDVVAVTGTLGRTAAALAAFAAGEEDVGNRLFRFEPRVAAGRALAPFASAMMDSSDGLARSLHQLADASDVGFDVTGDRLPVDDALPGRRDDPQWAAVSVGEDFELVVTLPPDVVDAARTACPEPLSVLGEVTESGVVMDGTPLPDVGWTHGEPD